ncbi:hypothetical protein EGT07_18195 [Herbaspirillum sp. HC18]|nr:hypothetical protein EGT07_18195 [Herbaspirillum sp. HC18]
MSVLGKRLARLEGKRNDDDLVVVIQRFGAGEYDRVKGPIGAMIERRHMESEEDFLARASDELVAATKREMGPQPCYVIQPLRNGEQELATTPQIRPQLSRDEWLKAHGMSPIDNAAG